MPTLSSNAARLIREFTAAKADKANKVRKGKKKGWLAYWSLCLCFITIIFRPFNMTMGRIKKAANLVSVIKSLIGSRIRCIIIISNPKNIFGTSLICSGS
jgi:hypothetical protein